MHFLFLDVDGVLNNQTPDFDHSCLRELKRIVDATKAQIVLSSSWRRFDLHMQELQRVLGEYGIELFSSTPSYDPHHARPLEIIDWLSQNTKHQNVRGWVVLDDLPLLAMQGGPLIAGHFVQTNPTEGLTKERADLAIRVLTYSGGFDLKMSARESYHISETSESLTTDDPYHLQNPKQLTQAQGQPLRLQLPQLQLQQQQHLMKQRRLLQQQNEEIRMYSDSGTINAGSSNINNANPMAALDVVEMPVYAPLDYRAPAASPTPISAAGLPSPSPPSSSSPLSAEATAASRYGNDSNLQTGQTRVPRHQQLFQQQQEQMRQLQQQQQQQLQQVLQTSAREPQQPEPQQQMTLSSPSSFNDNINWRMFSMKDIADATYVNAHAAAGQRGLA